MCNLDSQRNLHSKLWDGSMSYGESSCDLHIHQIFMMTTIKHCYGTHTSHFYKIKSLTMTPLPPPPPRVPFIKRFFSLIFVTAQCKHSIAFSLTPSGGISLSFHYRWTLNSNQYLYVHVFFFRRTWYRTMWCRYSCWWTWSPADSRDRSSSLPSANYSIRTRSSTWWTADHYLGKGALTLIKHAVPRSVRAHLHQAWE